jgi:hypothetical protein
VGRDQVASNDLLAVAFPAAAITARGNGRDREDDVERGIRLDPGRVTAWNSFSGHS